MKRIFRFIFRVFLWFGILSVLWVLLYKFVPVPYTPLMAIRYFEEDSSTEFHHKWKSIDDISSEIQLATVCAEDQNFLQHKGFDINSIKKAYQGNKSGKHIKGGSTISQQTAKNIFLWPHRSWIRKGFEAYFTFLIESLWTKERILEVYLNSIEMGDGIYGIEAASKHWFNKSSKHLNRNEAAAIAAILPNPRKFRASPRSKYIENRKNWIVNQMRNYGTFVLVKEKVK